MHLFRRLSLLLIVWVASFSTSSHANPLAQRTSPSSPDGLPHLQVSLFNDARLDFATLARAEARASDIFSQAGIEVDWLTCGPADPADFSPNSSACATLSWPSHLSVRIRPNALTISAETFGQAYVDSTGQGVYSNVYFQNLVMGPQRRQLADADMLGYVLAHELGHLLLGTNSHSPTGLMQARWDHAALSAASHSYLFFTPTQSSILRSRLSTQPDARITANRQVLLFSLQARL